MWNYRKSTADRLVASDTNISSLEDCTKTLQKVASNINIVTITKNNISKKEALLQLNQQIKTFSNSLQVHKYVEVRSIQSLDYIYS